MFYIYQRQLSVFCITLKVMVENKIKMYVMYLKFSVFWQSFLYDLLSRAVCNKCHLYADSQ